MGEVRAGSTTWPTLRFATLVLCASVLLGGWSGTATALGAGAPPPVPTNFGGAFLSFVAPSLDPGSSGSLSVTVTDPTTVANWSATISGGSLELQIYRFSYEGSAQNLSAGDAWAASFGSSQFINETIPTLGPGATTSFSVDVAVPSSASTGSFFVRDQATLSAGGTTYELRSRGYFSDALWSQATLSSCGPNDNCTPTLNLSLLGVSGVLPETGISVVNPWVPWVLGGVLAASLLLAAAAGYVAFRPKRGDAERGSSSGASSAPRRRRAARALGKSRSKDGD